MINDAAGCDISLRKSAIVEVDFCGLSLTDPSIRLSFRNVCLPNVPPTLLARLQVRIPSLKTRHIGQNQHAPAKSTASAPQKTHRPSHLQQRTSPSPKRSTQARPRRATPWLSQSKPGGGAPPAASRCCSLYVARPMPSRCRGDHSARRDGPNSG